MTPDPLACCSLCLASPFPTAEVESTPPSGVLIHPNTRCSSMRWASKWQSSMGVFRNTET